MAVIENLRTQVLEINASGGTNIWDALLKPEQCLRTYSVKYPNAKKRIVALSDGEDNAHDSKAPRELCEKLQVSRSFSNLTVEGQGHCRHFRDWEY